MKKLFFKKIYKKGGYTRTPYKVSGYTLVETMIAVSLFLTLVMAGMGSLLNANLLHQKSQGMRSVIDNLSFIMDDMSRNLRTGRNYRCIEWDITDVGTAKSGPQCLGIAFEQQNGTPLDPETGDLNTYDQWVYYIGNIDNGDGPKYGIWKSTQGGAPNTFILLNPDEVIISSDSEYYPFSVMGAESPASSVTPQGDTLQPFVTIRLVGKIIYKTVETPFSLETSISQRKLDR